MIAKLLTEHHLEFLSLKGGCRGSSGSTLVKMSNCWKSHAVAHIHSKILNILYDLRWHHNIIYLKTLLFSDFRSPGTRALSVSGSLS